MFVNNSLYLLLSTQLLLSCMQDIQIYRYYVKCFAFTLNILGLVMARVESRNAAARNVTVVKRCVVLMEFLA
jgi:hypothetical protein